MRTILFGYFVEAIGKDGAEHLSNFTEQMTLRLTYDFVWTYMISEIAILEITMLATQGSRRL